MLLPRKSLYAVIVWCFLTIGVCYIVMYMTQDHEAPVEPNEIYHDVVVPTIPRKVLQPIEFPIQQNVTKYDGDLADEITIVTAYINIGSFRKGFEATFGPSLYAQWMRIFRHIRNPVVAYLEKDEDITEMRALRSDMPANLTKIIKIHRDDLWAFGELKSRIAEIFSQDGYPEYPPNTDVPEYSCIMHAKYELMYRTVLSNPFKTKYFSWLDIGLFREIVMEPGLEDFKLALPPKFDESQVAYTEVNWRNPKLPLSYIIAGNHVWVCGAFFLGRGDVMEKWALQYIQEVQYMLMQNWMSTDQQVLYSLFNHIHHPKVNIQLYKPDGTFNEWFHLGYLCRQAWLKQNSASEL